MGKPVRITEIDKIIAKRIRLRRKMLNMSIYDLAKKCGVSFQQMQKYETNMNQVSSSRLFQISLALEIPIEFFFEHPKNTQDIYKIESLQLLYLYWKLPKNLRKNVIMAYIELLT